METKKTRLEAFKEARQTGQIAITERSARILEHMMELEQSMDTLYDDFSEGYSADAQDEIYDRLYNKYGLLSNALIEEFANHLASDVLTNLEFVGL